MSYANTASVMLKMLQIAALAAGTGVVGFFTKEIREYVNPQDSWFNSKAIRSFNTRIASMEASYLGRYEFFLYSNGVGAVVAVTGLMVLCCAKRGSLSMAVLQLFAMLNLAASTGLLIKVLVAYKNEEVYFNSKSLCDIWDDEDKDFHCDYLTGGAACGVFAALLFAIDAIVSFVSRDQAKF